MAVDAMIPIGRGQRELIIGDRATGKTAVALDAILSQAKINMAAEKAGVTDFRPIYSIYVAVGQKNSNVARAVAILEEAGAMAVHDRRERPRRPRRRRISTSPRSRVRR